MVKTTVYLPEDLKYALTRVAERRGESEAELIRVAIMSLVESEPHPKPRAGIISGGRGDIGRRTDELLAGFGDQE